MGHNAHAYLSENPTRILFTIFYIRYAYTHAIFRFSAVVIYFAAGVWYTVINLVTTIRCRYDHPHPHHSGL